MVAPAAAGRVTEGRAAGPVMALTMVTTVATLVAAATVATAALRSRPGPSLALQLGSRPGPFPALLRRRLGLKQTLCPGSPLRRQSDFESGKRLSGPGGGSSPGSHNASVTLLRAFQS